MQNECNYITIGLFMSRNLEVETSINQHAGLSIAMTREIQQTMAEKYVLNISTKCVSQSLALPIHLQPSCYMSGGSVTANRCQCRISLPYYLWHTLSLYNSQLLPVPDFITILRLILRRSWVRCTTNNNARAHG